MSVLTVDASVFGNAIFADEEGHAESRALLNRFRAQETPVAVPSLLLPELAAIARRRTARTEYAEALLGRLQALPHFTFVPLSIELARSAAALAARNGLRGADSVYVAVARRYGAVLVTLDREQLERSNPFVDAREPSQLLAEATDS
jgi:predicted nucleic acid-binding protein